MKANCAIYAIIRRNKQSLLPLKFFFKIVTDSDSLTLSETKKTSTKVHFFSKDMNEITIAPGFSVYVTGSNKKSICIISKFVLSNWGVGGEDQLIFKILLINISRAYCPC